MRCLLMLLRILLGSVSISKIKRYFCIPIRETVLGKWGSITEKALKKSEKDLH